MAKLLFCFTSFASDYNYKRAIFLDGPKKDFGKYSESVVPASALLHRSCVTSLACGYKGIFTLSSCGVVRAYKSLCSINCAKGLIYYKDYGE